MSPSLLLVFVSSTLLHQAIGSSCFSQSPWKNVRSIVAIIDPCTSIADCETACLANSKCDAYVYSTRCGLFGVESKKPQICVPISNLWQRAASCGGKQTTTSTTTTKAAPTTTSTFTAAAVTTTTTATTKTTGTTTTTKSTSTTTTSAVSPCGTLVYQPDCVGTCPSPTFALMETTCAPRYTLYVNGNGQGNLTCTGTKWTYVYMGTPYTFAPGSTVYCVQTM